MHSVGAERQIVDRDDRTDWQVAVEVGKEGTAARRLPPQRIAEQVRVHDQQDEARSTGAVLGHAFTQLFACRKMDETVAGIVGRQRRGRVA